MPDTDNILELSRSDLSRHDKYYRLLHFIQNRLAYFEREVAFRQASPYHDSYVRQLAAFSSQMKKPICFLQSSLNCINYNKTKGDNESEPTRPEATNAPTATTIQEHAYNGSKADGKGGTPTDTSSLRHTVPTLSELRAKDHYYLHIYDICKDWPKRQDHAKQLFGMSFPDKYELDSEFQWYLDMLAESTREKQTARMSNLLYLQYLDSFLRGWACLFATLTVTPCYRTEVFSKGSTCFQSFIQAFKRASLKASDGLVIPNQEHFHYFACTEEGSSKGTEHIHCCIFCHNPPECCDPNYGKYQPVNREIESLRPLWKWGFGQFIPVRFGTSDYWGRRGWKWPIDVTGYPLEQTDIDRIVAYLVKYMNKSQLGSHLWRTRKDKNLGINPINNLIHKQPIDKLLLLATVKTPPQKLILQGQQIQWRIIRQAILRRLFQMEDIHQRIRALPPSSTIRQLLSGETQNTQGHKPTNFGSMLIQNLINEDISEAALKVYLTFRHDFIRLYH